MANKVYSVAEASEKIRFLGRNYTTDYVKYSDGERLENVTFFDWTMGGFEIKFKGTGVSAVLVSNRFDTHKIRFYAYVDGVTGPQVGKMFTVTGDEAGEYVLCENLPEGEHTLQIRRASACCMGNIGDPRGFAGRAGLASLTVTGEAPELLSKPEDKKLKLEFIGDSITCGDNINQVDGKGVEDGTLTYAAYTAHKMDADINVMSISGNGCICCLFGTPLFDLPDQYLFTSNLAKGSVGTDNWDFSKYQPDVVVVNLGTNDRGGVPRVFSYDEFKNGCDKSVAGGAVEHHTGVKDFLDMIHDNNPHAKILWTCGAMGRELCNVINEAVREWNEKKGEVIAYFTALPTNEMYDYGKGYDDCHPSVLSSKIYSEILVEKINHMLND